MIKDLKIPKTLRLYLGPGQGVVHGQHIEVMAKEGPEWTFVDKYVYRDGWIKMDAGDLKYPPETVDTIYASHLLEHFAGNQPEGAPNISAQAALKNWYKVLKFDGKVIINVPDFTWACDYFLKKQRNPNYWDKRDTIFHFTADNVLSIFFGSQSTLGEFHYTGFTVVSLSELLKSVGFDDIRIKTMWDAHAMQVIFAEAYKRKSL